MIKEKYVKDLSVYKDVLFHSKQNTYIEHGVIIGKGTIIEPNVMITKNSIIGENNTIYSGAIIIDSKIGNKCVVGQHALIRDKTTLNNNVVIGPHSEIARSTFNNNSGAFHKCVIINARVHEGAKLGACVVTANGKHDGEQFLTIIEKDARIGVSVTLIAPVTIGYNSWVGAGSTIIDDIKSDIVVTARLEQKTLYRRKNAR